MTNASGHLRVGADVANNGKVAGRGGKSFGVDERRNGVGEVNAVHEDVGINDLLERTTLLGLGHIPLDDVLFGDTNILGELNGTLSTAAELQQD